MKKTVLILLPFFLFAACKLGQQDSPKQLQEEISTLEKKLLENKDAGKNKDTALQLIEKTQQYAKDYPQDTLTPAFLFKAGDVAKGAREFGKAVQLWGQVWRNYENHPTAPMALFLQGYTFDAELHDAKMAARYYNQYLQKYPDHEWAEQARQLLSVVEVKPEDLIKKFENQK
jgi:tetratricopeptide (TPR) repeat protein